MTFKELTIGDMFQIVSNGKAQPMKFKKLSDTDPQFNCEMINESKGINARTHCDLNCEVQRVTTSPNSVQ